MEHCKKNGLHRYRRCHCHCIYLFISSMPKSEFAILFPHPLEVVADGCIGLQTISSCSTNSLKIIPPYIHIRADLLYCSVCVLSLRLWDPALTKMLVMQRRIDKPRKTSRKSKQSTAFFAVFCWCLYNLTTKSYITFCGYSRTTEGGATAQRIEIDKLFSQTAANITDHCFIKKPC